MISIFSEVEFISSLSGAIVGGLISFYTAFQIFKWGNREHTTQKYLIEFLSDDMLFHRITVGVILDRIEGAEAPLPPIGDEFSIQRLARGFWNSGEHADYYKGPTNNRNGLNEHQSLEAILQYISRLAINIEMGNINLPYFKKSTKGSFEWIYRVLDPLIVDIIAQTEAHQQSGGKVFSTDRVRHVSLVRNTLEINIR